MIESKVSGRIGYMERHMPKLIDLTGKKFGRLTVIDRAPNSAKCETRWNCVCECGAKTTVRGKNLIQGITRSCGCIRKDPRPYRNTHGMSRTRLYRIWSLIKNRCENENSPAYRNYGGRGIELCEDWHSSSAFFEWALSNGYAENLTIDRIDNNKGYSPENCRWVDETTQGNNKRTNRYITIGDKTKTLAQWCREYNMNYKAVHNRITKLEWDIEKALTTPVKSSKNKLQKD